MGEDLASEEAAGVAEERKLVDVSTGEDVGAVVVGQAVIRFGVIGLRKSSGRIVSGTGPGGVLITERFRPGISEVELEIMQPIDESGLEGIVVCEPLRNAGVDGAVALIRTVVVVVGLTRVRVISGVRSNSIVSGVQAGIEVVRPIRCRGCVGWIRGTVRAVLAEFENRIVPVDGAREDMVGFLASIGHRKNAMRNDLVLEGK